MDQERGVVTRSHLQPGVRLIKNSANVMHNGRVNAKIKLLPPCLLEGTWHPTYKEHHYAKQNLYQLRRKYGQPQYWMQGCLRLQPRRGGILGNGIGDLCKDKGRRDGLGALERLAEKGPWVHIGGKGRQFYPTGV